MTKALVTMAVGLHREYLEVTRPSLAAYAARHGYAFVEAEQAAESRSPSWSKVPILLSLLASYDDVLWVDCDVVIVDSSLDLAAHVPPDAWQAMAIHRRHIDFDMGEVPSCGLWLARPPLSDTLRAMWEMTQYIDHPWWEQAAMHHLLGYTHNGAGIFPVRRGEETELRHRTHFLPDWWHSIDYHDDAAETMAIHVPSVMPHAERLTVLRRWAERAASYAGVTYGD